MEIKLKIAN